MGYKRGLLIGNGTYKNLQGLGKPEENVNSFAKVLRSSDIEIQELIDRPAKIIEQKIEDFLLDNKEENDLLLLYLSGYGLVDDQSRWYFAGQDSNENQLFSTAISTTFLKKSILGSSANLVILIDTCELPTSSKNKKAALSIIEKEFKEINRVILAASGIEQIWEGNDRFLSTFTFCLVQGIKNGAIENGNNEITIGKWFNDIDAQMKRVSPNQAVWKNVTHEKEALVIASSPTKKDPPGQESEFVLPSTTGQTFRVGGHEINLIILARGKYGPKNIVSMYNPTKEHLPPDLQKMRKNYELKIEKQKAQGVLGRAYNSNMYKLLEFDAGHRDMIDFEEVPGLILKFSKTDYFSQMVTDINVGNPIREKYRAKAAPITEIPVPEFSTILGVNLNVITKDNYLVITERSKSAKVAGDKFHTSVGENLLRPGDRGISNAPDPFLAVIRGAKEELGLNLNKENIIFTAFTVIPDFCQYSLIATLRIQETRAQVERIWHRVVPQDKWESRGLLFYQHHPDVIAQFVVSTWDRWFSVALTAVILSLEDEGYSSEEVDSAFLKAWSTNKK